MSRKSPLFREITGILVFKAAVILLAGLTIFGAAHRLHVGATAMSEHILSSN